MKDLIKSLEQMKELVERIGQRKAALAEASAKELSDYISTEIDIEGLLRHIIKLEWNSNKDPNYCDLLYKVGMGDLNYVWEDSDYETSHIGHMLDRDNIKLFLRGIDFERGKHG